MDLRFQDYLIENGIQSQLSAPSTPQHNFRDKIVFWPSQFVNNLYTLTWLVVLSLYKIYLQ